MPSLERGYAFVSILAHPERWALRFQGCADLLRLPSFQSSPTPKGGRYFQASSPTPSSQCFNPRPPRKVGATWMPRCCRGVVPRFNPRPPRKVGATMPVIPEGFGTGVSILAHPERWALLTANPGSPVAILFQSSPTPKGGRYHGHAATLGFSMNVSILAHPERWALPLNFRINNHFTRCFNPRPPRKVGATCV